MLHGDKRQCSDNNIFSEGDFAASSNSNNASRVDAAVSYAIRQPLKYDTVSQDSAAVFRERLKTLRKLISILLAPAP